MIDVTPVFGWGWSGEDDCSIEVPSPFQIEVASIGHRTLSGIVRSGRFICSAAELSSRHMKWDGTVNIRLSDIEGNQVNGFASVPLETFDNG